jgi:UTP:GlnB (protein PII) uridylyltransferase
VLKERLVYGRSSRVKKTLIRAVAEPIPRAKESKVTIDNSENPQYTIVTVAGANRPGLLTALSSSFKDLALEVRKVRL